MIEPQEVGPADVLTLAMLDDFMLKAKEAGLKPLRLEDMTEEHAAALMQMAAAVKAWLESEGIDLDDV